MKKNSEYIRFLFIGFSVLIIIYFSPHFIPPKIAQGINDLSCGYTYSFSKKSIKNLKFIGIEVDEYSLNNIRQRWPWRRSLYAQVIKVLDKEKVSTIGIDLAFTGESEDKEDDRQLKEALAGSSSRVVLAYFFDYKKGIPVLPLPGFRESCYSLGMLNTPQDIDGKTRRLRGYIEFENKAYYSFSVALSAAFLNQKSENIAPHLPLLEDKTFLINYLLKPKDIVRISFYDILGNLPRLKQQYGDDFLRDALVLIYPSAEILHDIHFTPLGKMPGGTLHLNGVADIISQRFIREINVLLIPFLICSLVIIFYLLARHGFLSGFLFTLGTLFLGFWFLILLSLRGIKFDYSRMVIFSFLFFIAGSLYKYTYFLTQLLKIKDKATLEPLSNLFTLRYFYYRLELELKKIYFNKGLFLVFIYLDSFKDALEDMPLEKIRGIWQKIQPIICLKASFWSAYSEGELLGGVVSSAAKINPTIHSLKNNLEALLQEKNIKSKLRFGYLKVDKRYALKEVIYILFAELKKSNEAVVLFKDSDLTNLLQSTYSKREGKDRLLEGLGQDIEDKNRQLLSLIKNLSEEHARTKEAYFQILASLINALEARDPYTQGHSQRVCNYSLKLAEKLSWNKEEKEKLKKAALLHDLGKIGIPDNILHKRGPLTDEEYTFIKKHSLIAVKILAPLKEFSEILPWILHHHEKYDGSGYPDGLTGDRIPLASQILALADVFDALSTGRDYKRAFSYEETIKEISKNKGTQFNPQLVDMFVDIILEVV